MRKPVIIGQSHNIISVLANNVDWGALDATVLRQIIDNPREAGVQFTAFLKNGGRVTISSIEKSTPIPLSDLIKSRFDWVNNAITNERFPAPDRLWNDYREFYFGDISSKEAVKRMKVKGYEPANSHDLLVWNGWDGENFVVALGSVAEVRGNRCVLCLGRYGLERSLNLSQWVNGWSAICRFLAVRKSSGS